MHDGLIVNFMEVVFDFWCLRFDEIDSEIELGLLVSRGV